MSDADFAMLDQAQKLFTFFDTNVDGAVEALRQDMADRPGSNDAAYWFFTCRELPGLLPGDPQEQIQYLAHLAGMAMYKLARLGGAA